MNNSTTFLWHNSTVPPLAISYTVYAYSVKIWMAIQLTINFLGAIINGVTFTATLTYRPLRQSSSCLLIAHCIFLDFLMCICMNPGNVLISYFGPTSIPRRFCRGWGTLVNATLFANNWAHCVLACNRFIAFIFPHCYKQLVSRKFLILAVVVPWVVAGVLNVLPLSEIYLTYITSKFWPTACVVELVGPHSARVFLLLYAVSFGVYVPCAIVGLAYSTVMIKARIAVVGIDGRRQARVGDLQVMAQRNRTLARRYEMSKMLLLCFIWYLISYFPNTIAGYRFYVEYRAYPLLVLALKGLQGVASAVNPILFLAVSKNYRDGIVYVLRHYSGRTRASVAVPSVISGSQPDTTRPLVLPTEAVY